MARPRRIFNKFRENLVATLNTNPEWLPNQREVLLHNPQTILCPLCLEIREVDSFTKEHVPPKRLGGSVICLTCTTCNNYFGMSTESTLVEWMIRRCNVERPDLMQNDRFQFEIRGNPEIADVRVNTSISTTDEGRLDMDVATSARVNNPNAVRAISEFLSTNPQPPLVFGIEQIPSEEIAPAAWKSAYLQAFSMLGYPYLADWPQKGLHSLLDDLRNERLEQSQYPIFLSHTAGRLPSRLGTTSPHMEYSVLVVFLPLQLPRRRQTFQKTLIVPLPHPGTSLEQLRAQVPPYSPEGSSVWEFSALGEGIGEDMPFQIYRLAK